MNLLFFKLAFRNILRNKFHSFINVLGFSIGIATTLFIILFIKFETSFDNFHDEGNRIFRILTTERTKDGISTSGFCWFPVASDIKNEISGIDDFCRVSQDRPAKCYINEQIKTIEKFRFVDANFFRFFSFQLIIGNPQTVLLNADNIVLSKKEANKIFGNSNPIGKLIIYNQKHFTVTGIAEDLPLNTHLKFDALVSTKYVEQDKENFWLGWNGGETFLSYLKLAPHITSQKIESSLPAFMYQKVNKQNESIGWKITANLQNIKNVHLSSAENHYDNDDNRNKSSLFIITSIGLLILVLAIFNYISLYVAQKTSKIKDISLLKIHGAKKFLLAVQTYVEVLLLTLSSALIGIFLLMQFISFLNNLLQTSVSIDENYLTTILYILIIIFTLSALITTLSIFPIYKIKAIDCVKETFTSRGNNNSISRIMVIFQFTIVILLITSGLFIALQNNYVLNKELGFNKKNILSITSEHAFYKDELFGIKQDLKMLPEIYSTCLTSEEVGIGLTQNGYTIKGEKNISMFNVIYTDADFLKCFDIGLVLGRSFYDDITKEKNTILINRQLVKKATWKEPLNKTLERNGELKVVGVVEDFNFASMHSAIEPLIIMFNPAWDGWGYHYVNIKYQTGDVQSLINKIVKLWQKRFPDIPYEVSFLEEKLAQNYKSLIAQQKLIVFFNGLAILIACMGLLGLTSFVTIRRAKEIGIRKINGAKVIELITMLNKDFIKWVALAFIIASPIAYYVMNKWLENFAYKTELSWWVFVLAGIIAMIIAILTVSWQSWKAATRNPVEVLRSE